MYVTVVKRILDITFSVILMVTLSWLFFLIILAYFAAGYRNIFFVQERVGWKGRVFRLVKFYIIRIYGFNLILLPVNIAGTLKSLQQAITTKKIPFARTPKVKDRTATAWLYLVSPLLILGFSLFTLWRNIEGGNWGNAAFAGFNSFAATWAIVAYIGFKNMFVDLFLAFSELFYVETPMSNFEIKVRNFFSKLKSKRILVRQK